MRTKFYINTTAKPDQDIDRVYFDGKFVYVEGETPIFYSQDGKMVELKPSIERVSYLNITSQPSGAEVFVNSESKGTTPTKISILGTKPVILSLSKQGFYTKIVLTKPAPGLTVDVGELLDGKKDLDSPVPALRAKLTDLQTKKDSKGIKTLRGTIQDKIKTFPKESSASIQKLMAAFPPNASQGSDESADDFAARTLAWQKDRDAEQVRLQGLADQAVKDLTALLAEIDAAPVASDVPAEPAAKLELNYVYIAPSAIQLGRFNQAKNLIEISIYQKADQVAFTYSGTLNVGSLSKDAFTAKKDHLQGVLKVWNLPNAGGKTPVSHGIAFFMDKSPLVLGDKGTYNSSDADAALNAKGVALEAKLAKLPSSDKASFDADETAKTTALLQTFATASAPSAPIPTVTAPAASSVDSDTASATTATADSTTDSSSSASTMPITAPVATAADASAVSDSDKRHEDASAAVDDIDAKFGRQDEYRRWGAWGLVVVAVGAIGFGALEWIQYNKANTAVTNVGNDIAQVKTDAQNACTTGGNVDQNCMNAAITVANQQGNPLYGANQLYAKDVTIRNSYGTGRNIFIGLAAASIAGSVVLFTW